VSSIDEFVSDCGEYGRFLKHSLYEFSPEDTRKFFESNGLATAATKDGCVFPLTNRASDVKRVLEDMARRLRVHFMYGRKVEGVKKQAYGFLVDAGKDVIHCSAVIITTGGMSWPFTGSTGDGYRFAEELGHTVVSPKPALVPMVAEQDWPGSLQGVGISKVRLSGEVGGWKVISTGALMFTGDGIGGPSAQDFSREITDTLAVGETVECGIDIMPDMDDAELNRFIIDECGKYPRKELAGVLAGFLPRAMSIFLCDRLQPVGQILVSQFSKAKRAELVGMMKSLQVTIKATRPIAEATVTRGGISMGEINGKTMESKICEGLFFAGEVMDVDGPCGGYNLQIAWSTGSLAGKMAAGKCSEK
jgi:hypothetical protein